jgi:hypothetical protein
MNVLSQNWPGGSECGSQRLPFYPNPHALQQKWPILGLTRIDVQSDQVATIQYNSCCVRPKPVPFPLHPLFLRPSLLKEIFFSSVYGSSPLAGIVPCVEPCAIGMTKGPYTRVRIHVRFGVRFQVQFAGKPDRDPILHLPPITMVCMSTHFSKNKYPLWYIIGSKSYTESYADLYSKSHVFMYEYVYDSSSNCMHYLHASQMKGSKFSSDTHYNGLSTH